MARSVTTIKAELGYACIAQPAVQELYGISSVDAAKGFDAIFSKVSPESLLFYAIAFCVSVFEKVLDTFRGEIQTKVDAAFVANKAWWHARALEFQKGYNLVLSTTTFSYVYSLPDAGAMIIKRVAVREKLTDVCKVQLLVATELNGAISELEAADKSLFETYADQIKPSGVLVEVITGAGDVVDFEMTVNFNPLLLNTSGELIYNGTKPVEEAINNLIKGLNDTNFGGNLNLTHLIDAVQQAVGVVDAKITKFTINGTVQSENWGTYTSTNGWFSVGALTITYQPQSE